MEMLMLGKIVKTTLAVAVELVFTEEDDSDQQQMDMLNDGMGNIVADDEHMTEQEAKDVQGRGDYSGKIDMAPFFVSLLLMFLIAVVTLIMFRRKYKK